MKKFLTYIIAGDVFLVLFLYYIFVQKKSWDNPYMLAILAISVLLYLRGIYFLIKWNKERKRRLEENNVHSNKENQV